MSFFLTAAIPIRNTPRPHNDGNYDLDAPIVPNFGDRQSLLLPIVGHAVAGLTLGRRAVARKVVTSVSHLPAANKHDNVLLSMRLSSSYRAELLRPPSASTVRIVGHTLAG